MPPDLQIICGDALTELRKLPDESVQCCVTSPPFWGLRDYGTARWEGGDESCDHKYSVSSPYNENFNERWGNASGAKKQESERHEVAYRDTCGKCGAKRIDSQLGLEKTPEEYVAKMVEVFREVRRVLRKDGTLWLNLGDSYAGSGKGLYSDGNSYGTEGDKQKTNVGSIGVRIGTVEGDAGHTHGVKPPPGLKAKDLVGIPWRVAFALQDDGWWLRSDIIWAKPNPMPESVTDRPTKSHEYLFLLTKSSRYFYDSEAIKEQASESYRNDGRWESGPTEENEKEGYELAGARNPKRVHSVFNGERKQSVNKRSVWTVATAPYPEAHFATYPPDLIKPCIMAGSRVGDTVLDPFAGSGTTGAVALELGRSAILIELNPKYVELIRRRCSITPGLALA